MRGFSRGRGGYNQRGYRTERTQDNDRNWNRGIVCRACNQSGHRAFECPTHVFVPRKEKIEVTPNPGIWWTCIACNKQDPHHSYDNCPDYVAVRRSEVNQHQQQQQQPSQQPKPLNQSGQAQ